MADYMPLLKAIEKVLAKADADLEAFLEEQGYPNPSGLVEAIDSVQDVLEELLDDYLERIATVLIDCTDKFELMDAWNETKEDAELKRAASDAVAEALFSYALPFLDEYIKNDDEELDASELSLKAIAEVLTLADQMTEGKIDSLNDRIEAGLQNYKEPEDSEADKAEKAAVEKGVLDDLKSKLRGLGSKIKSFGQRAIEYVFGSSKLDRARDCRGTATQTVLMYESVVQQEAIMQNPVVERKIWRHNPSDHPRENHVAMDGVMADADGFFELTGRDGNVYRIEGPRASSLPPSESYNCHCTVETVTNAEILNSDVETKSTLQDEAVANANEVFKTSADKELYERAMEWAEKFTNGSNSATLGQTSIQAHPITQKSIDSVPCVKPSGWSAKQAQALQKNHKDLLSYVQNEPVGTEAGFLCDMDGNVIAKKVGGMSSVSMSITQSDSVFMHNHPDNQVFSGNDLSRFVMDGNLTTLTAVGNNGKVYAITKSSSYDGFATYKLFVKTNQSLKNRENANDLNGYIADIYQFLGDAKKYGVEFIEEGP